MNLAASANPEDWGQSQHYELGFWRKSWPYRDLPLQKLQEIRHADCHWFLRQMGLGSISGTVLEVGCGPIGFFELMQSAETTGQDSLMRSYARHLSFATLGRRGATTYIPEQLSDVSGTFDFVVCSNVLDHTADWIEFLALCVARIRPGGSLLLFTDSRGVPAEGHTQIFSPQQLKRVVELLGARQLPICKSSKSADGHCDYKNAIRAVF